MKIILVLILVILISEYSIAQPNKREWLNDLDSNNFEVFYKKRKISKPFLEVKNLNRKAIENLNGNFRSGCIGRGKRTRLNWVSIGDNGIEFYSFSFGGRGFNTKYFVYYRGKVE